MLKDKEMLILKVLLILLGLVIIILISKLIGVTSTKIFYPFFIITILLSFIFAGLVFHFNLITKHKKPKSEKSKIEFLKPKKQDKKSLADEEKKLFSEISKRLKKI